MNKLNQRQQILNYIDEWGSITSYEAYLDLGITQLSTRLSELKEQGYVFTYDWIVKKNRYGKNIRFKEYKLKEGIDGTRNMERYREMQRVSN